MYIMMKVKKNPGCFFKISLGSELMWCGQHVHRIQCSSSVTHHPMENGTPGVISKEAWIRLILNFQCTYKSNH